MNKRTIRAPAPKPGNYNIIQSAVVDEDEDVVWIWSAGNTHVIGYNVVKRKK